MRTIHKSALQQCIPPESAIRHTQVVSRTVRDTAAVLDAVHGSEPGDLFLAPPPTRSYVTEVGADPGKLRIGILTRTSFGEIHSECREATAATAKLLESLGHRVEESFPEALFETFEVTLRRALNRASGHGLTQALGAVLGRPVRRDDVEPFSWFVVLQAEKPPVVFEEYLKATQWLNHWARRVAQWWSKGFDLLLTPTIWEPPATLVEMTPPEDKPWKLLSKIQQASLLHLTLQCHGRARGFVAAALDARGVAAWSSARGGDRPRRPADSRCGATRTSATVEQAAAAGACLNRR